MLGVFVKSVGCCSRLGLRACVTFHRRHVQNMNFLAPFALLLPSRGQVLSIPDTKKLPFIPGGLVQPFESEDKTPHGFCSVSKKAISSSAPARVAIP